MQLPTIFKPSNTYILATSGGVDSMVLLDLIAHQQNGSKFIVAHFDHAIRGDSQLDAKLVAGMAKSYGLEFEVQRAETAQITSEVTARIARYEFLENIQNKYDAAAVVTAHHQDDVVETMIINLMRGTNRRGLSSLQSHGHLIRPLLAVSKQSILAYAHANHVRWREDSTNGDTQYLRNWVRKHIVSGMNSSARKQLLEINKQAVDANREIDAIAADVVGEFVNDQSFVVPRYIFVMFDRAVVFEILSSFLRSRDVQISEKILYKTWLFAKTAKKGVCIDVASGVTCCLLGSDVTIA